MRWAIALRDRIRLKAGLQFHIVSAGPVSVRDLGNGRKQFREFNFANSTKIEELIWSHSYADAVCTLLPASSQLFSPTSSIGAAAMKRHRVLLNITTSDWSVHFIAPDDRTRVGSSGFSIAMTK